MSELIIKQSLIAERAQAIGAVLLLALPLSLGWHPVPTLGSLAEAVAVFCVAALLVLSPPPRVLNVRGLALGTGGLLALMLLRCLIQPLYGNSAYAGFWFGPFVVLATAFLVCCYCERQTDDWLNIIASAILLAALINAVVGFMQYWRVATILDLMQPYVFYWDRTDPVAHGNVAQRNILASLCLLGIAASLYRYPQRTMRIVAMEGFLAYVVALTASRTPLAILLVVTLVVLFRDRHWRAFGKPVVRWFVVPVLIAQVLAPIVNHLLFSLLQWAPAELSVDRLSAHGLGIRSIFYRLAAGIGMESWISGLGWKSLPAAMIEHGYRQQLWGTDELPLNAHNVLLQLWVENGLFLALLASLYPVYLLLRGGFSGPKEEYARLSLAVLIVHSWLEYPLWQPALLFFFVVLMRTLEPRKQTAGQYLYFLRAPVLRWTAAAVAIGAAVTAMQLIVVAEYWQHMRDGRHDVSSAGLAQLKMNPVIEPYADWLELNMKLDAPAQRIMKLERLAKWIPDSMMLGLLANAYRCAGRIDDAQRIDSQRVVVFGVLPESREQGGC